MYISASSSRTDIGSASASDLYLLTVFLFMCNVAAIERMDSLCDNLINTCLMMFILMGCVAMAICFFGKNIANSIKSVPACSGFSTLLTDAYSRKIPGWTLVPTLGKEYPLRALKQTLSTVTWSPQTDIIHHSDRGCQYCSYEHVECLKSHNIRVSMTQSGDPLENAIAERANGILKTEWLYHMTFRDIGHCSEELPGIIHFYNNERPHMSLGYNTPDQVHRGQAEECKIWKNPWQQKYEGSPMI